MTDSYFTRVSLLLALLDATIAFAVLLIPRLRRRREEPRSAIRIRHLLPAFAIMVAACVVKLFCLMHAHWDGFGLINATYSELVAGVPLFCAGLLIVAAPWPKGWSICRITRPTAVLATIGLLAAPVGFYTSVIEPFRLVVEEVTVPLRAERAGSAPIRIGVIADVQTSHVTNHERAAFRMLMEQRPDIILLAGDLFQGGYHDFERELPALRELHAGLSAPGGVFCVLGNLDNTYYLGRITEGTGIRLLCDEIADIQLKDRRLILAGLNEDYPGHAPLEVTRRLENTGGPGDIRILLAHRPDVVFYLSPRSNVDLVVAGHTHGGQIRLPWVGALARSSRIPRTMAGGGLFELGGHALYVNRGIGVERGQAPSMRFLCPPTVSILELSGPVHGPVGLSDGQR
jgi:uncharacterized protein